MDLISSMAEDYKLLGDKTRLTILSLLKTKEMCVCDIVDQLGVSQSCTSQHLRKLKAAGIVNESRRGQWVYYSLMTDGKEYIQRAIEQLPVMESVTAGESSC